MLRKKCYELEKEISELRHRIVALEYEQKMYLRPSSIEMLGRKMKKHIDEKVEEIFRDRLEIKIKEEVKDK